MNLKRTFHNPQFSLFLVYLFLGFAAIIVQSILIREFFVISDGNELVIGSIFSVWFLWIAIGAGFGTVVSKKTKYLDSIFWVILFSGLFLFPIQIITIRFAKSIFSVPIGTYIAFWKVLLCSFVFISPFSFMIGITFPLGTQLFQKTFAKPSKIIGNIYIYESMGSLVGGLLFTFFMINFWNPIQISVFLLVLAVLTFLFSHRSTLRFKGTNWLLLTVIVSGLFLTIFANSIQSWSVKQRWLSFAGKQNQLISSLDTPYDHISLSRLNNQYSIFQNGQLSFSFPEPYSAVIEANLILLQHPKPESILVIGAGFCNLLGLTLEHKNLQIDWIIKDQKLFKLLEPLLSGSIQSNNNVNIFFEDGRSFIRTNTQKYDLIYLDLPPPSTASLNRFYSYEFFLLVRKALKENGTFAFQLPISDNYLRDEVLQFASSIYKTLQEVFSEIEITSSEQNFLFASNGSGIILSDFEKVLDRWNRKDIDSSKFSPYSLLHFFESERINFLKENIKDFIGPKRNSDLEPISYLYNLVLWNIFSGNDNVFSFLWNFLGKIKNSQVILVLLSFVCFRFGWLLIKKKKSKEIQIWNSLFGVFVAGFTAIGLEVVLIFGYQNLFGSLYQNIALLTAVFMFGLGLGSWFVNRCFYLIKNIKPIFISLEIISILLAFFLPILFQLFGVKLLSSLNRELSQFLYFSLVILVGIITGAVFPLAGTGLLDSGKKISRTASSVEAFDHLGACLGAFLTGTFLIPIIGFMGVGWTIASINFIAILFWLVDPTRILNKER